MKTIISLCLVPFIVTGWLASLAFLGLGAGWRLAEDVVASWEK